MRAVEQVGRHFADVVQRAAGLLDQNLQILHRLVRLCGRIILAMEFALEVGAGQAAEERCVRSRTISETS